MRLLFSYHRTLVLAVLLAASVPLFRDPLAATPANAEVMVGVPTNDLGVAPRPSRTPAPLPTEAPTACRFTGSITPGDPTMTGRLFRDGIPDSCGASGTCSVFATTGARRYDKYTFSNTTSSVQCATVTLSTSCAGTQFIYAAAYLGSFNPDNLCQNWLADSGDSPNPNISFSFNVPAGATVVIVVHALDPAAVCPSYNLEVSNICPPTTCSITGSIAAGDPVQTGRLFRDGIPDACAGSGTCSVFAPTGSRRYDSYLFANTTAAPECESVTLSTACNGTQFLYAAAYLGSFNPNSICQNGLADSGDSPNPTITFSFNIPAGQTVVLVVHELDPDAGCPAYMLTVSGCSSSVNVLSSVSRKMHGAAGTFDVPLPVAGTPSIEPRSGGDA